MNTNQYKCESCGAPLQIGQPRCAYCGSYIDWSPAESINKDVTYIHYGAIEFNRSIFKPIKNINFIKPKGGLWASRTNAKYGWKDWCEDKCFRGCKKENSFSFYLKQNANVIHLYSVDDLICLPQNQSMQSMYKFSTPTTYLDFERMLRNGIDAIEIHISEDKSQDWNDNLYYRLYGWDCDSILIMNPEIIVPIVKGSLN